jgi:hypothetical protein
VKFLGELIADVVEVSMDLELPRYRLLGMGIGHRQLAGTGGAEADRHLDG